MRFHPNSIPSANSSSTSPASAISRMPPISEIGAAIPNSGSVNGPTISPAMRYPSTGGWRNQ